MSPAQRKRLRVTLYTKDECGLCDVVKEALERIGRDLPLVLEEVDITSDPVLYERYRTEIPVVLLEGKRAAKYHLDEAAFRLRCERLLGTV